MNLNNPSRLALVLVIVLGLQVATLAVQVTPHVSGLAKTLTHPKPTPVLQPVPTLFPQETATPSASVKPTGRVQYTPTSTSSGTRP